MRTRGSGGHNSASRARVYTRRKIAIKLQAVQIDSNLFFGETQTLNRRAELLPAARIRKKDTPPTDGKTEGLRTAGQGDSFQLCRDLSKRGKDQAEKLRPRKIQKGSILEPGQRAFLYRNHKQKGGHARPGKGRATANRQTETAIMRGIAARHNPYNSTGGQE